MQSIARSRAVECLGKQPGLTGMGRFAWTVWLFAVLGLATGRPDSCEGADEPGDRPQLVVQVGHVYPVQSVAISADGRTVLTGSWDNTAILWDAVTGRELRRFSGHTAAVASVALSRDGRTAATMSWEPSAGAQVPIFLWDTRTGGGTATRRIPLTFSDGLMRLLPSGDVVAYVHKLDRDGVNFTGAALWNSSKGVEILSTDNLPEDRVDYIFSLSDDGRYALLGGWGSYLRVYDLEKRKLHAIKNIGLDHRITAGAVSADGKSVGYWQERMPGVVNSMESAKDHEFGPVVAGLNHPDESEAFDMTFAPGGRIVATGHKDGSVCLW